MKQFQTHKFFHGILVLLMVAALSVGCSQSSGNTTNCSTDAATTHPTEIYQNETTTPPENTTVVTEETTNPSTELTEETTAPTENTIVHTQAVTFTNVNETVYASRSVNVRSEPNSDSQKLGSLKTGDPVSRTGIGDNGWSRIEYQGKLAYAYSSYLSTSKPTTGGSTGNTSNNNATSNTGESNSGNSSSSNNGQIIYTYPDGTTGTTPKEGATYEMMPGVTVTYHVYYDGSGRTDGDICEHCGKVVSIKIPKDPSKFCKHYSRSLYCDLCGTWVEANSCHDCRRNNFFYCSHCGKVAGDGANGTCVRWLIAGDHTCTNCKKTVLANVCHTCDEG